MASRVAFGVVVGMASVAGGVTFGMVYGVTFVVVGFVERSIKYNQHFFITRIVFILLLSSYAFLIWFFYLGGWQMFKYANLYSINY